MAIKSICVNLKKTDSDSICSIYKALMKIPCLVKYDRKNNELLVTCQEKYLVYVEKVVARYV